MKFFYDTEFLDNGETIQLISIGIVAEDGREYYAVNSDMPVDEIKRSDWLMENVMPSIPNLDLRARNRGALVGGQARFILNYSDSCVKPRWVIRNEVRDFLLSGSTPELYAWYAAYDHVAYAQLFGPMVNLPAGLPMFTHDVRSLSAWAGVDMLPKQAVGEHNALEDARHVKVMFEHIIRESRKGA